jgi:hypothetical protein
MQLLIKLIQQLQQEPGNDILEFLISQYTDKQINDACCYIRSGITV